MEISKKPDKKEVKKKAKSKKKARIKKFIFIPSIILMFVGLLSLNHIGPWLETPFTKAPYLSWSQDPMTTMTISWETPLPTTGVIEYGKSSSYGNKIVMDDVGNVTWLHIVTLTGLEPNTTYHYRVYSTSYFTLYFLLDRTFTTAPNDTRRFSFAVYGDNRPDVFGITAHQIV